MAIDPAQSLSSPTEDSPSTQPMVGKGWVQGVALVMIFGFFVMGILAYRTYTASMPHAGAGSSPRPVRRLFTGADITAGQELFQAPGLMQYGSIVGHGAYLGPDYTADYLRRADRRRRRHSSQAQVPGDPTSRGRRNFRTNRYDEATKTLVFTDNQVRAFDAHRPATTPASSARRTRRSNGLLARRDHRPARRPRPDGVLRLDGVGGGGRAAGSRLQLHQQLAGRAPRGQRADRDMVVWSALSLIALLGGTGVMFAIYGRWSQKIGWHSAEAPTLSFRQPGEVALTPSQRATAWFFCDDRGAVPGPGAARRAGRALPCRPDQLLRLRPRPQLLPFNLARTWHLQLSLLWTAAAFLAAGIFLTPFIARREPRRQHWLAYGLLGAVVVVVVGSWSARHCPSTGSSRQGSAVLPAVGVPRPARGSGRSC